MKRALLFLALLPAASLADVRYTLTPDPAAKQIRVTMTLESAGASEQFEMPAWAPGFYTLLKFHEKVSDFKAVDPAGQPLQTRHSDPRVWSVDNPNRTPITVSYKVLGDDPGLGFFRVSVTTNNAFVNGPGAFMFSTAHMTEKAHLTVKNPAGWDVATSMDPGAQSGAFVADGYDELADHPIQLGKFARRKFTVEGIPFEAIYVSVDQRYAGDLDAATERLRKVSIPALKMFGGASFKRYVYIIHLAVGDFAGGLEHRATNVQAVPNVSPLELDDLAAHEYFHAWNIKQIRPAILGPFDYSQPQRTGNLWFSEGVTDYYAKLHTYQSGLRGVDWLLDQLSAQISELESGRTRLTKTVEDASREVWEAGGYGYVGDLSYYTKGLVIGLVLDSAIRSQTHGKKSLDDVMRLMYARYKLPQAGFPEDGVLQAVNEVAGADLTALYTRSVRSTEGLPYDTLGRIGLRLLVKGKSYRSMGFEVANGLLDSVSGDAATAGLKAGDKLISVDGAPFTGLATMAVKGADSFKVVVERGGVKRTVSVPFSHLTASSYSLQCDPFATPEAVSRRVEWLRRLGGVVNRDH